jgi:hypothetical protein
LAGVYVDALYWGTHGTIEINTEVFPMSNLHDHVLGLLAATLQSNADTPTKLNQSLRVLAKYRSTLLQNTIAKNDGVKVQGGAGNGVC